MKLKDTFLSKYPAADNMHAYTVIYARNGKYLLVNFTKRVSAVDHACVCVPGDHEFVKEDTVMEYRRMLEIGEVTATHIEVGKIARPYKPISDELLKRIREGAIKSKFTERRFKEMIAKELEGESAAEKKGKP